MDIFTTVDGFFDYSITRSKRNKRIQVSIKDTRVKVVAPIVVKLEDIKEFVQINKVEILSKINEQKAILDSNVGHVVYLGENYKMRIRLNSKENKVLGIFGDDFVVCLQYSNDWSLAKEITHQWYIEQANTILTERLNNLSRMMGLPFKSVKIKDQKTIWGSCSKYGNINLNWRLIKAPLKVIEYVIIHELAHLMFFNHSEEFWQLVSKFQPDYKENINWLKNNKRCEQFN